MLQEFHQSLGAQFTGVNGSQVVNHYGDWMAEYTALRQNAGVFDLSCRSRICLVGSDRGRFLHGQVTNDVKKLGAGDGCYAAITTAKGKMEADMNIFCLADELLLDLEPGLAEKISQRLEKYIVADDVQIVDAAPHYGLISVQGPKAGAVMQALALSCELPAKPLKSVKISDSMLGDIYVMHNSRLNGAGFDLFVPNQSLGAVADKLVAAAKHTGGRACGWQAYETLRIEAGIPRYGADMDESNIPLECGLESRAITYTKGCYIGQEVINRIHSVGRVTRELRGLRLADELAELPSHGTKLFSGGTEVGYVTSAIKSPALNANIALGYVRREANDVGKELVMTTASGESAVKIVELPFI